ncbi:zinc transporter 10 [Microcaecilia unicolor]|uniref:Zinc transporter 10-like n=1 Tax=Microcaecilia unicolor TaxID=1415580 RepID=A0A6P7XJM9_9AMPH|nr:zinc transporter 10-like [Microcaecilia unicolor]
MGRYTGKTCRLIFMLVLTGGFFVAELVSGYLGNSIALVSDSFSMLSDLISLCVGLTAARVSHRTRRGQRATFGYSRAEVVGALCNAVFLTALYFTILVEALMRLARPEIIDRVELVLIVGVLGLVVNIVGLLVFQDYSCFCPAKDDQPHRRQRSGSGCSLQETSGAAEALGSLHPDQAGVSTQDESDEQGKQTDTKKAAALNIRGVLLHVMGDALGSVVVVIAATIFYVKPLEGTECTWQCYIDPSLTVLMVIIVLSSAFPLIKETSTILLQMVPKGVDVKEIGMKLAKVPGVSSIHEMHIWELASGMNIATFHVKCQDATDYNLATQKIRQVLHNAGIHSVTIQPEFTDQHDSSLACSSPCISQKCDSKLCCSQQQAMMAQVSSSVEMNGNAAQTLPKTDALNGSDEFEISIEPCWGRGMEKTMGNSNDFEKTDEILKSTHF